MPISPSRYDIGVQTVLHKGKKITTSLHQEIDNNILSNGLFFDFKVGYVINGYEHRPDLISQLFYDTPAYWWLLMQINNVDDPFEGFDLGDRIIIPVI